MEEVIKYTIVFLLTMDCIGKILLIGDERKPITKAGAVVGNIVGVMLIYGILKFL